MPASSPDHHDLVLCVSRVVDSLRQSIDDGEPDWRPLRRLLPLAQCDGFMWMGSVLHGAAPVEMYKHGITRRYLHLDHSGGAYRYGDDEVLHPIDPDEAVEAVYDGIEEMGWSRTTAYDEEFVATRNAQLAQAGYTVIS